MKRKLYDLLFYIALAIILYFIINVFHLSWYIANPEGFFGFTYFIEILSTVVMLLVFMFLVILCFWLLVTSLISFFRKKETRGDFLRVLGAFMFILFFLPLQYVILNGISSFFSFNLAEKYSLINRTEKLLNKDKFDEALELSTKSYEKEKNRKVGWFFILTKLYSKTDFDKKEKLFSKYKASINYGYYLKETLNNADAEEIFKEALIIAKSHLLTDVQNDLLMPPTLYLAEINLGKQNIKAADDYFNKYSKFLSASDYKDIEKVIASYQLFINHAARIGDLKKANKLQLEVLYLYDQSELSKDSDTYLLLLLLACLSEIYDENFTNASNLLLKSIPIAEDKKNKPIYLIYLNLKAKYCTIADSKIEANEKIIKKSFFEKIINPSDENLSIKERMLLEAEECHKEIVAENKVISGVNSTNYLYSLIEQGNFYYWTSQYDKAEIIYEKALRFFKTRKNIDIKLYNIVLTVYLKIKSLKGNIDLSELIEVENFIFNNLNNLNLTEEEKEKYVVGLQYQLNEINEIYVNYDSDMSRKRLYNNIIRIKNVALSSNSALRDYIRNSDIEMKLLYKEILNDKKKLNTNSISFNSLKKAEYVKSKENKFLEEIYNDPKFKKYLPKKIIWDDIRNALKKNEIAIEIFNLPLTSESNKDTQYFALLTHSESKSPVLINLFKGSELNDLLSVKGNTKEKVNIIYNRNSEQLYKLIFAPIENLLNEKSVIYLSKSGALHNVSFPALLKDKSWDISLFGSTKQIIAKNESQKTDKVVLFGGIDYNSVGDSASVGKRGDNPFNYKNLKYTKEEVLNINNLFLNYEEKTVETLTENEASERALRDLSGSETSIIHIATHGYYNNGINSNLNLFNNNELKASPLIKSGLLLAGANNSNFDIGDNDGNLTSLEISELDFSNVDLVILSACETGLGDILGSEGVFGLQRAFKLAGVKSLIVSLWQVPDKETSDLMYKFYFYYLEGASKREALLKAQNDVRKKNTNPYYWAGFEMIE
jgi:CHAT domain-containing protein